MVALNDTESLNGTIVRSTVTLMNISTNQLGNYQVFVSNSGGRANLTITVERDIRKCSIQSYVM